MTYQEVLKRFKYKTENEITVFNYKKLQFKEPIQAKDYYDLIQSDIMFNPAKGVLQSESYKIPDKYIIRINNLYKNIAYTNKYEKMIPYEDGIKGINLIIDYEPTMFTPFMRRLFNNHKSICIRNVKNNKAIEDYFNMTVVYKENEKKYFKSKTILIKEWINEIK